MEEIKKKKWYKSKTLWFNFVSLIVLLTVAIIDSQLLTPTVSAIAGLIVTFGNGILRIITTSPVN